MLANILLIALKGFQKTAEEGMQFVKELNTIEVKKRKMLGWMLGKRNYHIVNLSERQKNIQTQKMRIVTEKEAKERDRKPCVCSTGT